MAWLPNKALFGFEFQPRRVRQLNHLCKRLYLLFPLCSSTSSATVSTPASRNKNTKLICDVYALMQKLLRPPHSSSACSLSEPPVDSSPPLPDLAVSSSPASVASRLPLFVADSSSPAWLPVDSSSPLSDFVPSSPPTCAATCCRLAFSVAPSSPACVAPLPHRSSLLPPMSKQSRASCPKNARLSPLRRFRVYAFDIILVRISGSSGSVSLKTYLPDGDMDLNGVCRYDEEVLSRALCDLLQNSEHINSDVCVRNVQCVPAQVDELIGQDHLFRRSVLLIKAWCFYESRILGSEHGLISSYALETMVLHIINMFHSSLRNPLAVFRKFLDYFGKFDWEKHCVAVEGLALVSSLPEIVVQKPDGSDDMLLSAEFLRNCRDSTEICQNGEQTFDIKFLNIVDPLRVNNNLGGCVYKGNFYRINAAFAYGNRKLAATLALPPEEIIGGIEDFFEATLERITGVSKSGIEDFVEFFDEIFSSLIGDPPSTEDAEDSESESESES